MHIVTCVGVSAVTPIVVVSFVDAFSVVCTVASKLSSVVEVVAADRARVMGGTNIISAESSATSAGEDIGARL
jgi:hypothetical protein